MRHFGAGSPHEGCLHFLHERVFAEAEVAPGDLFCFDHVEDVVAPGRVAVGFEERKGLLCGTDESIVHDHFEVGLSEAEFAPARKAIFDIPDYQVPKPWSYSTVPDRPEKSFARTDVRLVILLFEFCLSEAQVWPDNTA